MYERKVCVDNKLTTDNHNANYSETHSTWNLKRQAMLHSGENCRHSDKGSALRTFWKLYESGPWRQARWWQMISHSALPKPSTHAEQCACCIHESVSKTSVGLSYGKPNLIANWRSPTILQQHLASAMSSAFALLNEIIWERVKAAELRLLFLSSAQLKSTKARISLSTWGKRPGYHTMWAVSLWRKWDIWAPLWHRQDVLASPLTCIESNCSSSSEVEVLCW